MPFRFNGFNENWLFREKSAEIFQPNSYWAKYSGSNKAGGFDDHFLIDFCDTSKDLYAAYFDHFKIEGIPETYKAFTSFLSNKSKAQALGIYSTYLNSDDFSFVLVRLFRRETRTVLDGKRIRFLMFLFLVQIFLKQIVDVNIEVLKFQNRSKILVSQSIPLDIKI